MNIKNLKPGDKVKLFKLETLIKKGLISVHCFGRFTQYRENPNRNIGITYEMQNKWNNIIEICNIYKSHLTNTPVIEDNDTHHRWLPEWIRCRVR